MVEGVVRGTFREHSGNIQGRTCTASKRCLWFSLTAAYTSHNKLAARARPSHSRRPCPSPRCAPPYTARPHLHEWTLKACEWTLKACEWTLKAYEWTLKA
eukprot:1195070-Prorocentrum_minimum.AAC.6